MEEFHLRQDEIAERVSKSRTAVTNSMRLLKLDDRVQQMVVDEMLTTGHVRTLLLSHFFIFQYRYLLPHDRMICKKPYHTKKSELSFTLLPD